MLVWCDILFKLFPKVKCLAAHFSKFRNTMHTSFAARSLRAPLVILSLLLILSSATLRAQSPAIQPCQSAPGPASNSTVEVNVKETVVDSSIADDPAVEKLLSPYAVKVKALDSVIGQLVGDLKKTGVGASTMGNFVTDGVRLTAIKKLHRPIALAIVNASGLRKNSISEGVLRYVDIFELLPFENALVKIDLTGSQLIDLLQRLTNSRDAQSGARIHYRWNDQNRPEFISARLLDDRGHERQIDPESTYSIVTIDYLLKVGSSNYAILQEGKNVTPLNVTIRDAIADYVKTVTASGHKIEAHLDDRFIQVGPSPVRIENPPND